MNKENAAKVIKHLQTKGLNAKEIAALMGNIAVESGYTFDPAVTQKGKRSDPAYGLFQFDPRGQGLYKPYQEYLKDKKTEDSLESQLDFMVDSIFGNYKKGKEHIGFGNVNKFKEALKTGTADEAAVAFSNNILRPGKPHIERRVAATNQLLPEIYNMVNPKQPEVTEVL